ncbi:hypothetical protein BU16DRAFT_528914 [Lophium mytilinum]|uniref:Uncharacterized protein n=1 Tax=Lophium mytilinum TaxID=390894 RepID=A0A6A6QLF0_9PEZI|nr:hypothetical protein BU16DRAFT_528914 [Lophium mytilinum]
MKSFATIALTILVAATTISARPNTMERRQTAVQKVSVQLTNDRTGSSGVFNAALNNGAVPIVDLFLGTGVDFGGVVLASSAQFVGTILPGAACVIKGNDGRVFGDINDRKTFTDLDGDAGIAIPQNLNDATLECQL